MEYLMVTLLTWQDLIIMWLGMIAGYIIFGMTGFGSALILSPLLTFFLPLREIVPLLALLDCGAAIINTLRDGKKNADKIELLRLTPLIILGSLIGAAILLFTKPEILLLLLGIFVIGYSLYNLMGHKPSQQLKAYFCIPFGFIGGIFSALFGSGGFIYAIYLAGRLEAKEAIRVTQTTLIGFSTLTRIIIFAIAGIYSNVHYLLLVILLLPTVFIGSSIGRKISINISKTQFLTIINIVLFFSGMMLIIRYFS